MTFGSALAGLLLTVSTAMAQAPDAAGSPPRALVPVVGSPAQPRQENLGTRDQSIDPVAGSLGSPIFSPPANDRGTRAPCDDVFATADLAHKRSCAALVVEKANLSPAESITAMHLLGLLFEMKR